jgi:hypothetical protein
VNKILLMVPLASLALAGCAPKKPAVDPAQVRVYVPEPSGKTKKAGCQGTCQVSAPEALSDAAADVMLSKVVAMPVGTDSLELDTLLFHDHETTHRLDEKAVAMSPEWETFLRRELARRNVTVSIRVIDEAGVERATVDGNWEIGVRAHHVVHDVKGVPPFEASGTLVRVGREHLWVRM